MFLHNSVPHSFYSSHRFGSGWDKELAAEIDADFVSIACPTPYRIVLTTNYVGYTGGLRVIEDIYNTALATYK